MLLYRLKVTIVIEMISMATFAFQLLNYGKITPVFGSGRNPNWPCAP